MIKTLECPKCKGLSVMLKSVKCDFCGSKGSVNVISTEFIFFLVFVLGFGAFVATLVLSGVRP